LFFLVTLSARLNLNLSLNFNNMHKLEKRKDIFRARKKVRPLKWIAVLLCLVLLASCSQDEDLYDPLRHEVLPAVIDTDQILDAGTHYWLTRTVCVTDSATLTILPGTLITADPLPGRQKPALVICSGSRIVANGTEDAPVVLTSAIEEPGSWGGLTVLGQAPVNNEKTDSLCPGTTFVYGGEKEQDDSGLLYFVRVESVLILIIVRVTGAKRTAFPFWEVRSMPDTWSARHPEETAFPFRQGIPGSCNLCWQRHLLRKVYAV
jgi:hypothetical protein